jgi:hypothetical protein
MPDPYAQIGGSGHKAGKQGKSKKKKKPSRQRQLAPSKRNTVSSGVIEPLSQVESMPPKVGLASISTSVHY